jgi:uncharacterized coiled-coil protein SlyX
MDDQLAELQMLLMDQQQSLEEMSQQLVTHTADIEALDMKMALLESRLKLALESISGEQPVADEKPPHY